VGGVTALSRSCARDPLRTGFPRSNQGSRVRVGRWKGRDVMPSREMGAFLTSTTAIFPRPLASVMRIDYGAAHGGESCRT